MEKLARLAKVGPKRLFQMEKCPKINKTLYTGRRENVMEGIVKNR